MTAFNVDHGFLEGWVRGMRNDMLKGSNYAELVHCETLEGFCLYRPPFAPLIVNAS
jgi:V-type H+-transporting ATPase subunit d